MDIINDVLPKEKNPQGRAPKFSVEYYLMMAKQVVDEGMSYREACKVYNCSHGTVSHWVKQFRSGVLTGKVKRAEKQALAKEQNFSRLEKQIRNLKAEIGELYLENTMLKKALEYSRLIKREDSSVITSESLDQSPEVAE